MLIAMSGACLGGLFLPHSVSNYTEKDYEKKLFLI